MSPSLIVFAIAFLAALLLVPLARALSFRLGAVDVPGELAIHTRPIPRAGGLAILGASLTAVVVAWWRGLLILEPAPLLPGIFLGSALIALAGLLDDVNRISPLQKFLWQLLATSVVMGLGVHNHFLPFVGLGIALTPFYLVGAANAVNLLDGMDGLAAGVVAIAAFCLGLIATLHAADAPAILAFALAGAALGFLPYNFPRARIFMGDVGSLFTGFTLACVALLLTDRPYNLLYFAIPLTVLGVPALDTALAIARRFRRRDDLFSGDRDHTYDLLARRWGQRRAVVAMWAAAALLGAAAVVAAWLAPVAAWAAMALLILAGAAILWLAKVSGALAPLAGTPDDGRAGLRPALAFLRHRYMHPLLLDLLIVVAAFYLALLLRFTGDVPGDATQVLRYARLLTAHILFIAVAFAICGSIFGLYSRVWRYASSQDVLDILAAGAAATGIVLIVDLLGGAARPLPVSVVFMGGLMSTVGMVALRYRQRLISGLLWRLGIEVDTTRQRVLIVGAGDNAQHLAGRMQRLDGRFLPVGFVDRDLARTGLRIRGIPVLGTIPHIPDLVARHRVELIVIAKDGASPQRLDEIFDTCRQSSARIQVLPDVLSQLDAPDRPLLLRDLNIEDLFGRPPRRVDEAACRSLVAGQVLLVTGAAGSIGAELCRQLSTYGPACLLALDRDETGLYNLGRELQESGAPFDLLLADVTDHESMEAIWRRHRPAVVFHCAAYKHVPILEDFPGQAVHTNVQGTLLTAALSRRWGTGRYVFVSTDKAACPVNVLGASKRVAELLTLAMHDGCRAERDTPCRFCAVRFGNVLGSRGSVVPTFAGQIARGGPVTITHPRMERFFMSVQEAVSLVIQAAAYTTGGDLFVLDMGDQVRIEDVARKMIRLRGLRVGDDIPIQYVGTRPGEKLSEQLLCPVREFTQATPHRSILAVTDGDHPPPGKLASRLSRLLELARTGELERLRTLLFDTASLLCPQECAREHIDRRR